MKIKFISEHNHYCKEMWCATERGSSDTVVLYGLFDCVVTVLECKILQLLLTYELERRGRYIYLSAVHIILVLSLDLPLETDGKFGKGLWPRFEPETSG